MLEELIKILQKAEVEFEIVNENHIKIPMPIASHEDPENMNDVGYNFGNIDFDGYVHVTQDDEDDYLNWLGVTSLGNCEEDE